MVTTADGELASEPAPEALSPDAPVTAIAGVGPATARRLEAAGIARVFDLACFFPRRYRALRELAGPDAAHVGELVRIPGVVHKASLAWLPGRRAMVTITFACDDGSTFAAQFFNQPWMKKNYPVGQRRVVEGTLQAKGKRFVVQQPKVLPVSAGPAGEVQLRYPEVEGVSASKLQHWIGLVLDGLDYGAVTLPPMPAGFEELSLTAEQLLLAMHRPADVAEHEHARRHFAVREALALFGEVEAARSARERRSARGFPVDPEVSERILSRIPFALTNDQRAAAEVLWQRLAGPGAMGALLQGDVGTGKTAVAVA
ncbi:MAG: hypothetical protein VXY92_12520, partial [Planctomycetota bacterium]|nr:hypothetical protein [Planctomycetota bacterium]